MKVKPFVKWAGGKRSLLPEITARLPDIIESYREPFLGGGAVFFALHEQIKTAYLSDANQELITTYQVIQNNVDNLIEVLQQHKTNHHRIPDKYYYKVRSDEPTIPEKIAGRFIYLNKTGFNGLYRVNRNGEFNVAKGNYSNPDICNVQNLKNAHEALQKANLFCTSFENIESNKGDFIYCDPPYDGAFISYHSNGFTDENQKQLKDVAVKWHDRKANIMLSNSNTKTIRDLYSKQPFYINYINAKRSLGIGVGADKSAREVLVTTYPTANIMDEWFYEA